MNTAAFALLIVLAAGCASTGGQPEAMAPDRIAPGRVAVVTGNYTPETSVHSKDTRGSMAGEKAAQRALGGAGVGLVMPLYMGPVGIVLYPFIAPFTVAIGALGGGVVGAVEGSAKGMSASLLDPLHSAIERAVRQQEIRNAIAQSVMQQGAALPHYEFTYVTATGPSSASDRPDYQRLKADGFDTVLELSVASVGFEASKGEPPSAVFEMKLNVRVVPFNGHGSPFVRELQHRSQWRGVPEWAAEDGKLLEEEFNQAYGALAVELSTSALWPVSAE